MSYQNTGEVDIEQADDANVPINSFLIEPDDESQKWRWNADLFMPRKGYVMAEAFGIEADTKEEIIQLVNRIVIPLYEAALANLKAEGQCYYWRVKTEAHP